MLGEGYCRKQSQCGGICGGDTEKDLYVQPRIRMHDPPNPKQEVSAEILKGMSFQLWRVCYVFAMSLLFVAECMQVLIGFFVNFRGKIVGCLGKKPRLGQVDFISFSCKYHVQLIKQSEIK